jgi:hypothetical protein
MKAPAARIRPVLCPLAHWLQALKRAQTVYQLSGVHLTGDEGLPLHWT